MVCLLIETTFSFKEDNGDFCNGLGDDPNCPGGCYEPDRKGDGYCDDGNNNCACEWDGGDCCEESSKKKAVIIWICDENECKRCRNAKSLDQVLRKATLTLDAS